MLRWIFIMLVLANAAYFAWHQISDKPPAVAGLSADLTKTVSDQSRIVLLREAPPIEVPAVEPLATELPQPPQTTPPEPEEEERPMCWKIGPFKEELGMASIKNRFKALDMKPVLSISTRELAPIYWVYIEPQADKVAALRLSNSLHSQGIDSYVILTEEDLINGISLGFFVNLTAAEKIKATHKGKPYRVAIKKIDREKKEIWAVLPEQTAPQLTDELWARLKKDFADLEINQNYCDLVVSEQQFE